MHKCTNCKTEFEAYPCPTCSSTSPKSVYLSILFATNAHEKQLRSFGGGIPYVFHPIEVAKKAADWGHNDVVLTKSLVLHDVVEDTKIDCFTISSIFGDEVANIVKDLTYFPHRETKQHAMERVAKAEDIRSLVGKVADRVCNFWDFYELGKCKRAAIYLAQGLPFLYSAVVKRQDEIISLFDKAFYAKMKDSIPVELAKKNANHVWKLSTDINNWNEWDEQEVNQIIESVYNDGKPYYPEK